MAKFRFNLEHVLDARKRAERVAQRDLNEKLVEMRTAEEVLGGMQNQMKSSRDFSFLAERDGGTSFVASTQVYEFQIGQKKLIGVQESKIRGLETEVEKLREALRACRLETTMIEKLKEKKLLEFKELERRREAKELDDMVMVRFGNRTKDKGKEV